MGMSADQFSPVLPATAGCWVVFAELCKEGPLLAGSGHGKEVSLGPRGGRRSSDQSSLNPYLASTGT